MLTIQSHRGRFLPANADNGDREVVVLAILSRVCVGLAVVVVAAAAADWSVADWTRLMTEVLIFLGGLGALGKKLLVAIRKNGEKTDGVAAGAASAARSATTVAVAKAIEDSALPTSDEQRAKFIADLAAEIRRQDAVAAKPRVLT